MSVTFTKLFFQVVLTLGFAPITNFDGVMKVLKMPRLAAYFFPCSLLFCLTLVSSLQERLARRHPKPRVTFLCLQALLHVSTQTVLVARNFTTISVTLVDWQFFNFQLTKSISASILTIILGISVFASSDVSFNAQG